MKKFLKFIGCSLLCIIGVVVLFIAVSIGYAKYKEAKALEALQSGIEVGKGSTNKDEWKNEPSDIAGMTLWDKYEAGLSLAPGADTDHDGLTDQEELEIYHTDPLKMSTAGDLYTDGYKVKNGMDPKEAYAYEETIRFPYNECNEVSLEANIPTDFNAVVQRPTYHSSILGEEVLAEYKVYNYSGKLTIDVSSVLRESGIKLSQLKVYVSDGTGLKSYGYTNQDNVITLKKNFSEDKTYQVYLQKDNFINSVQIMFGSVTADHYTAEDIEGAGLIVGSPLLSLFPFAPTQIYYETLGSEENTQILKEMVTALGVDILMGEDESWDVQMHKTQHASNKVEILMRYETLKNILPMFEAKSAEEVIEAPYKLLFTYVSYENALAYAKGNESQEEEGEGEDPDRQSVSGFDYIEDTLPFGNFKSEYGTTGNCAGISHLTAYLYNTKTYQTNGTVGQADGSALSWDLTGNENATLLDSGLNDFKDKDFVINRGKDGKLTGTNLSADEMEFVKMIGDAYQRGNDYANFVYNRVYGGDNADIVYDYAIIESMKKTLESGKILDVYLRMVDGTGHAVNIYGYEADELDSNVTWFTVYDSNFPKNNPGEHVVSEEGFRLRVEKQVKRTGEGYTFTYDYFPIDDKGYGASSNKQICENGFIIIMDENWHILND